MNLINKIKDAGIVGCGGAGFPTHVKLNCNVEHFIINGAECEPLLRTDRYLMINKAIELVNGINLIGAQIGASRRTIALKYNYIEEIKVLKTVIEKTNSNIEIFELDNFYPAGDEQAIVCEVTGKVVPPSGIPLDVGIVINNVATVIGVYESSMGINFTHKYLTITGEVENPTIVYAPIGASFAECISLAGRILVDNYVVIEGGPLMGKQIECSQIHNKFISKTTSGLIVVPKNIPLVTRNEFSTNTILRKAKTSCIQCSFCTELCPRYLSGHPLKPNKIMRKLAYNNVEEVIDDEDIKQALICCECGICEVFACPMGIEPRKINQYVKKKLQEDGKKYEKNNNSILMREERQYRKVSSKRIAARLGIKKYYDYKIKELSNLNSSRVSISLKQHIGAPSIPLVKVGDKINVGEIIAIIPENSLGSNIHASIDGIVVEINENIVIERR